MSVEGHRIFRLVRCCLLALFAATALPTQVMSAEADMETYYESEPKPEGMFCLDGMIEEPYYDELEPTPVADADGCTPPEVPILT